MARDLDNEALELAKLASDASRRALAEQERAVRDLRVHAGTLLAAASLTVGFLGAGTLDRTGLGVMAWLAVAAFVVTLVAALHVLSPRAELRFAVDGSLVYARLAWIAGDMADVHRRFTYWIEDLLRDNQAVITVQHRSYRLATGALVAQAILWVVQLAL